ncbi:hypothetical protein [Aedoeadaptatus pacaensis]|uniref:hypothetical protein n=1 Tax=Aedoeadaptatus pacaensis TaxID=1776390 RepID=UPI00142F7C5B|nr:hypothetical protein [Peptoniphilus pacaensis]
MTHEDGLPFFKKAVPMILAAALLLPLTACGGAEEDPVTEFKIRNDRIGTEISFNLPGNEEDWYVLDHQFGGTSEDFTYNPEGENFDATNSWCVQVEVSAGETSYQKIVVDGKEPVDDSQSVVESESGMKWVKTTNDNYHISYSTCLDEYLNGYRTVDFTILPNGNLEEGQEPDLELYDKIEKTILNSFKYDSNYKGKPDFSDAAYTGSHRLKWPFEIPFEGGVIKAEEYLGNDKASVKFQYEDPANPGVVYRIELARDELYDPEAYDDKAYFDRHFSNNEDPEVEKGFEEMEIAGYPAAIRFNDEDFRDEVVIELVKDKAEKRLILDMMTYIDSDNDADKADVKNKQMIIDMVTAIINSAQFPETAESGAD